MISLFTLLAQTIDPIGRIIIPTNIPSAINPATGKLEGVIVFLNSVLKLVFLAGGLWGFLNIIVAGFGFLTAGGDAKAVGKAWERIWQSLLGLFIIVSSFLIAAVIGILLFKDPTAILQPKL